MNWFDTAIALVSSAVEGKYGLDSDEKVRQITGELKSSITGKASELDLTALLEPPAGPIPDIINQLVVLALIELKWRDAEHPGVTISRMHGALFGNTLTSEFRKVDFVPDFGGQTITPWQEIAGRMDELERSCDLLLADPGERPISVIASFAAHLFSAIIRIHPFADGNGRTARMFVQYLLRRSGCHYLVIPKVRNDNEWRRAVECAISDDKVALMEYFASRVERSESGTLFVSS